MTLCKRSKHERLTFIAIPFEHNQHVTQERFKGHFGRNSVSYGGVNVESSSRPETSRSVESDMLLTHNEDVFYDITQFVHHCHCFMPTMQVYSR